ncbi:MAG: hypothetical protein PVF36_08950, partial [Desulfobacterales bacterium]
MDDKIIHQSGSMGQVIEAITPDVNIRPKDCLGVKHSDPGTIVIMGATGDLTARKLVPALFNLYLNAGLPDPFCIVGCGRTKLSDPEFRNKMKEALRVKGDMDALKWPAFAAALNYQSVDYGDLNSFMILTKFLRNLDRKYNTGGNRIFYLAIPPTLYQPVAQMIGQAGLAKENRNG